MEPADDDLDYPGAIEQMEVLQEQDTPGGKRHPEAERALFLLGWPGHRTLPGRSGLDPLETYNEEAHMEGVVIRKLLTGHFRTTDSLSLVVMVLLSFLLSFPLILYLVATIASGSLIPSSWTILPLICYSPAWILSIFLMVNAVRSVYSPVDPDEDTGNSFY